jgi:hypothetical protein
MEEALSPAGHDGGDEVALSPLGFLLGVMKDPEVTSGQRIRAARIGARYVHAPTAPEKMPPVDEYGFSISRTLANAIKEDWFELTGLGVSSKAAPRHSEICARQAERDEFLSCPPSYSAVRDLKRQDKLLKKMRRSMAEETELAFMIARITASEAAFNRSPEGRARRRIAALQYRREAANQERNCRVGLTRAEGKELDELLKQYPPKGPRAPPLVPTMEAFEGFRAQEIQENGVRTQKEQAAAAGPDPDPEMEELAPTVLELFERQAAQEAELIERRKASGDPDPWGGKAPYRTIHELELRRFLDEITPAEESELQQLARLYPERVEKMRKMVERRFYGRKMFGHLAR